MAIDHYVELLHVPVDDSFPVHEEQGHRSVFKDLELFVLPHPHLIETLGVVLHKDLTVGERDNGLSAEVLANEGTNLVPHEGQKPALVQ